MTDKIENIVTALRICGEKGIAICDGKEPNVTDVCAKCPNYEHILSGSARECFNTWLEAANELEKLFDSRHANWEAAEPDGCLHYAEHYRQCSACKSKECFWQNKQYCSHCGAKIDGDKKDDNK